MLFDGTLLPQEIVYTHVCQFLRPNDLIILSICSKQAYELLTKNVKFNIKLPLNYKCPKTYLKWERLHITYEPEFLIMGSYNHFVYLHRDKVDDITFKFNDIMPHFYRYKDYVFEYYDGVENCPL